MLYSVASVHKVSTSSGTAKTRKCAIYCKSAGIIAKGNGFVNSAKRVEKYVLDSAPRGPPGAIVLLMVIGQMWTLAWTLGEQRTGNME